METWRHVSQDDIRRWRQKVKTNLATKPGHRYEYDTAFRQGLDRVEPNADGSVTLEAPTRERIREARETVEVAAREMAEWIREDRTQFMHRVRMLKQMGNMQHLTDEEAAEKVWNLCVEIAQKDARRVYEIEHGIKPVRLLSA